MKIIIALLVSVLTHAGFTMDPPRVDPPQPSQEKRDDEMSGELVKEVAPGVYAGQTQVGNETVYFGMEKIDDVNIEQWDKYKRQAEKLTTKNGGLLTNWSIFHKQNIRPPFSERIQKRTGFSDENEYAHFMDKLDAVVDANQNIVGLLIGIPTGIAGFNIKADGNSYVVYASKKPVTGRFPFPVELPIEISLKKFYEYFGDILMIVKSEVKPDADSYANRGIFKNPISFIEDGNKYPGLSMKLHGFSAAVVHHIFKNKQYMSVAPAPAMRSIIVKMPGWQRGDLIIDGKDILDFSPEELEKFKSLEPFAREPGFHIKLEALIRLYKGK